MASAASYAPQRPIEEDEVEYEALPDEFPFVTHMAAGALAGIAEHCALYPVDTIKVSPSHT